MSSVAVTKEEAPKAKPFDEKKVKPLNEMRFHGGEFKRNTWVAFVEKDVEPDDVLDKDFWANCAAKLRAPDKIIVVREDRSFYRELIVFMVASNWAVVRPFGEVVYSGGVRGAPIARPEDDYEVADLGLHLLWGILNKKTGQKIKGDGTLKNREAAEAWLRDWIKAQSGVSKMS